MDFNEYQKKARETAIYPRQHEIVYPALGVAGEAGEIAEKVKKEIRDKQGSSDQFISAEFIDGTVKEMGDVLWYLASLAEDLGVTLEEVAQRNIEKLAKRKQEGKLNGSGDNR